MTTKTINELCDVVRETAYTIHVYHGHGHMEKVYENALAHRLRKMGLDVQQQPPIKVLDEDGTVIGDYNADLLVDDKLLMNIGSYKFQIKKYIRIDKPNWTPSSDFGVLLAIILVFFAFLRGSPGRSIQPSLPRENTIEHKAEETRRPPDQELRKVDPDRPAQFGIAFWFRRPPRNSPAV